MSEWKRYPTEKNIEEIYIETEKNINNIIDGVWLKYANIIRDVEEKKK